MIRRRALWGVVAGVVVAVGMFLFGYPTRTYLEQRAQLTQEQATVDRLAVQNQNLSTEANQLQNTGEIERIARQNYGLVQPGQEAYAILPAPTAASAGGSAGSGSGSGSSGSGSSGSGSSGRSAAKASSGHDRAPKAHPSGGLWSRFVHQLEFWN